MGHRSDAQNCQSSGRNHAKSDHVCLRLRLSVSYLCSSSRAQAVRHASLANSSIKGNQERTVWTAFFLPKTTATAIVERLARVTSDALDPLRRWERNLPGCNGVGAR